MSIVCFTWATPPPEPSIEEQVAQIDLQTRLDSVLPPPDPITYNLKRVNLDSMDRMRLAGDRETNDFISRHWQLIRMRVDRLDDYHRKYVFRLQPDVQPQDFIWGMFNDIGAPIRVTARAGYLMSTVPCGSATSYHLSEVLPMFKDGPLLATTIKDTDALLPLFRRCDIMPFLHQQYPGYEDHIQCMSNIVFDVEIINTDASQTTTNTNHDLAKEDGSSIGSESTEKQTSTVDP